MPPAKGSAERSHCQGRGNRSKEIPRSYLTRDNWIIRRDSVRLLLTKNPACSFSCLERFPRHLWLHVLSIDRRTMLDIGLYNVGLTVPWHTMTSTEERLSPVRPVLGFQRPLVSRILHQVAHLVGLSTWCPPEASRHSTNFRLYLPPGL